MANMVKEGADLMSHVSRLESRPSQLEIAAQVMLLVLATNVPITGAVQKRTSSSNSSARGIGNKSAGVAATTPTQSRSAKTDA